jgi:hypothetical protein
VDLADPRFAAVVNDHRFAIDPQDKSFKDTKARGGGPPRTLVWLRWLACVALSLT